MKMTVQHKQRSTLSYIAIIILIIYQIRNKIASLHSHNYEEDVWKQFKRQEEHFSLQEAPKSQGASSDEIGQFHQWWG